MANRTKKLKLNSPLVVAVIVVLAIAAFLFYQNYQAKLEEKSKRAIIENCQTTAKKRAYDVWLGGITEINLQYPELSKSLKNMDIKPEDSPNYQNAYKKNFDDCLETAKKIRNP